MNTTHPPASITFPTVVKARLGTGEDRVDVSCLDCRGFLVAVDVDGSVSGVVGAPVPCDCSGRFQDWNPGEWALYRAGMDRIVASWVAFYGVDAGLVAERQAWVTGEMRKWHAGAPALFLVPDRHPQAS